MTLKKLLSLSASCVMLLGTMAAVAGNLYKSTMANGEVVYSNVPPEGARTVKMIDSRAQAKGVQIATPEDAVKVETHRTNRRQRGQAQLAGNWTAQAIRDAYEPDQKFTLVFELKPDGDGFSGVVREIRGGDSPELTHEIVDGSVDAGGLSFYTQHQADAEGKPVPYRTMYKGRVHHDRIAFTRYDDHPQGGLSEQFIALRKKDD
jgi:hypothetical protein